VGDLERSFAPDGCSSSAFARRDEARATTPETRSPPGDVVAVMARRHVHTGPVERLGPEMQDRELLDYPGGRARRRHHQQGKWPGPHSPGACREPRPGSDPRQTGSWRQGDPFGPSTVVNAAICCASPAPRPDAERAAKALGYVDDRRRDRHDFVGPRESSSAAWSACSRSTVGTLPLSLTASGGALVMGWCSGLAAGRYADVRPHPRARALVCSTRGPDGVHRRGRPVCRPSFVAGLKQTGPSLLVVGFLAR